MKSESNPNPVTAASILTWGLFANPVPLTFLGWQYWTIATPWTLVFTVAAFAFFIGIVAAYVPARLAALSGAEFGEQAESIFGKLPGLLVARMLTPLWALSWFALSTGWISALLLTALKHGVGVPPESAAARVMSGVGALGLTVPFAARTPLALALNSRFAVKVALMAVTALMLSTIGGVPSIYLSLKENDLETRLLDREILLWALPAVMFATGILAERRSDEAAVRRYALLGVALPLAFVVAAGVLTLAGAADWSIPMAKFANYQAVFMRRKIRIGWGKGLVMVFALVTASRFSLHVATRYASALSRLHVVPPSAVLCSSSSKPLRSGSALRGSGAGPPCFSWAFPEPSARHSPLDRAGRSADSTTPPRRMPSLAVRPRRKFSTNI